MYEEDTELERERSEMLEFQAEHEEEEDLRSEEEASGKEEEASGEEQDDDQGDLSQYKRSTAKRMQQLMKDRREAETARRKAEREREADRKALAEMQKRIAEIEQEANKAKAESAKAAWRKALEEQDDDAVIAAQEALMEAKMGHRPGPQQEEQETQEEPQPGPGAESWVADNQRWFAQDPDKLERAKAIEKELFRDGYAADDDATYIELDSRLNDPDYKPMGRKRNPPSNPTQRDSGNSTGGKPTLDAEQKRRMVAFGLDKDNPKHRKYWLESLRGAQT